MGEQDWLAQRFEEHRSRLAAVAYRMLGSRSEADDAVQEAWLRLSRADPGAVHDLGRWLTTVVGRVCLDMLRSRAAHREEPLDEHVPEPATSRGEAIRRTCRNYAARTRCRNARHCLGHHPRNTTRRIPLHDQAREDRSYRHGL